MTHSEPVPPDAESRIKELAPLARQARRQHAPGDPKVLASKELTELFKELYASGCTIPVIAKVAKMTYHSVSARIKNA